MRKTIVAGNWKMNMNHREGATLAREILAGLAQKPVSCEVVLFPPFTTLPGVIEAIKGSSVRAGAQDLFHEDEGAFTGEISGRMLRSLGCAYVLVGHSERRHVIGETGELLAKKLRAALRNDLLPILCVGELLEERESGGADAVVERQIGETCEGLPVGDMARVVVAYEPVWAIGTGRTATPDDASGMHRFIRETLGRAFGAATAQAATILYGGSVKPDNASALLEREGIDGFLVGGASLKASSFIAVMPR
jgi:triosephosphate isomerase